VLSQNASTASYVEALPTRVSKTPLWNSPKKRETRVYQVAQLTTEFWISGTGNAGSNVGSQEPGVPYPSCTYIIVVVSRSSGLPST
jgi:hypothetical protein